MIVSVVVPVYNTEQYLCKCIESLLFQTFSDFEILLVDDGSTDKSGQICDMYANKDSRVRVLHKKNGGVSSARNMGIKNAIGKYLCFVDSDDFVSAQFLECLLSAIKSDISLVVSGVNCYNNGRIRLTQNPSEKQQYRFNQDGFSHFYSFFCSPISFNALHGKLYSLEIVRENNILFPPDVSLSEDLIFNTTYCRYTKSVCNISVANYFYRQYERSSCLTNTEFERSFQHKYEDYLIKKQLLIDLHYWNKDTQKYLYNYLWMFFYKEVLQAMEHPCKYIELKHLLNHDVLKDMRDRKVNYEGQRIHKFFILNQMPLCIFLYSKLRYIYRQIKEFV